MTAPTPEAEVRRVCMALRLEVPEAVADDVQRRILAALRAARAAAIEEAMKAAEAERDTWAARQPVDDSAAQRRYGAMTAADGIAKVLREAASAIRALGEESAG